MMHALKVKSVLNVPKDNKCQPRRKTLQQHLIDSYKNQMFVDAEIRVQNRIFKAHRCILAFHSPIFQKSFYGRKNPSPLCILNDVNPEGFDTLLKYIYSSQIPAGSKGNHLVHACVAAKKLEMIGVTNKLINSIFDALCFRKGNIQQFWSLLENSHLLKLKELEEKLLTFAKTNIKNVLIDESFAKASSDVIKLVLSLKSLITSNCEILERIAHWKERNKKPVQDLLSCVKFTQLSPAEFYNAVSKHKGLIVAEDALNILMHLVNPTVCSLPSWCSLDDKRDDPKEDLMNSDTQGLKDWRKSDNESLVDLRKCDESTHSLNWRKRENESLVDLRKCDESTRSLNWRTRENESLGDLRKCDELTSSSNWRKSENLKSLEDCKEFEDSKSLKDWCEFNFGEKSVAKTLPESFQQMFEEELFTDVNLCDSNGIKIPVHKLILALQSSFFANMLYNSTSNNSIQLECSAEDLKAMLRCFYGINLKISSKQIYYVMRLYDVALKYDCYKLSSLCSNIFESTSVTPGIFWTLFHQSKYLKNYKLRTNRLTNNFLIQPKNYFSHESFLSAHKNELILILKEESINMCEWNILEYVARWIENNLKQFPTVESRKEILKHIRFEALSTEQFFSFLKVHDKLLSKEDAFAILTYLFKDPKENSLPAWCYLGPLRRFMYCKVKKIGSNVSIPWNSKISKGANLFRFDYTATISNTLNECQIQYLELSWNIQTGKKKKKSDHTCNIIIDYGASEPLTFINVKVQKKLRILVPFYFTLSKRNPKMQFNIEVKTQAYQSYIFLNQKKLSFENMVIESNSDLRCVSDAIVDNQTSEKVTVPKNLITQNHGIAVPTENVFRNLKNSDK